MATVPTKAQAKKIRYKAGMRRLGWRSISTANSDKLDLLTLVSQEN